MGELEVMALARLLSNDFYRLSVFLAPLAFAELAVDVAEQVGRLM